MYAFSNLFVSSNVGVVNNLGIGTTTPAFPLDLNIGKIGNVGTQAFSLISSTTTASNTFSYTGSTSNWVVPAGVTSVSVYMWAGGGSTSRGVAGGGSAFVQGVLSTTPGETLTVFVGAGGGTNGNYGGGGNPAAGDGGPGGGRSAILRGSVEVVDVGAGGGAGVNTAGSPGVISAASTSSGSAQGGSATSNAPGQIGSYGNGTAGSQFQGGNGGNYCGGGGAGYYGGAGGSTEGRFVYSGGGGGSSLIANLSATSNSTAGSGATPGGTGSTYYQAGIGVGSTAGVGGNGLVVIVYVTNVFSDYGTIAKDGSSNMMITSTSNLRLMSSSNVGINQTQPLYPLDVSGTGRFTSNLLTGSGTAAAPAHSFASDPSSGMHLIGNSQLSFDTSGVSRLAISNSNVGIGTTVPAYSLDMYGGTIGNIVSNVFVKSTAPATVVYQYTGADQSYVVPGGVSSISLLMWGGGGGGGPSGWYQVSGQGAFLQGTLAVTPGQTLTVMVGSGGAAYNGSTNYGGGGGGWGQGGGRSAIISTASPPVELVDVGGGGGAGPYSSGRAGVYSGTPTSSTQFVGVNGSGQNSGGGGGGYYGGGYIGGDSPGNGGTSLTTNLTNASGSNGLGNSIYNSYYVAGVGTSAGSLTAGGPGLVVIIPNAAISFGSFGSQTIDASSNFTLTATSNLRLVASNVGINQTTPLYPLDVSGTGRFTSNVIINNGLTISNGFRPLYGLVTGTSLTPATTPAITSSNYGTYFNITNSGFNTLTLPTSTYSTDSNAFWVLRNNTASYLSITTTYTGTGGGGSGSLTIPPANSTTIMFTSNTSGSNAYTFF
jgi:hypothetical protein